MVADTSVTESTVPNSFGFYKTLNACHLNSFFVGRMTILDFLKVDRYAYFRLPLTMLKQGSQDREPGDSALLSWSRLVSWSCSQHSCVTSSESDDSLNSAAMRLMPMDVHHCRDMFKDPHIMVGVSFSFGDSMGYFMPLPTVLPLTTSSCVKENSTEATISLCTLPSKCQELICRFVGYLSFFNKCPLLREYFQMAKKRKLVGADISHNALLDGMEDVICHSNEANPLFFVSKMWCSVARKALLYEWRRGACIEWQLLADIMADSRVGII